MGQGGGGQYTIRRHLTLPAALWRRLAADATSAGVSVSCLVAKRLAAGAGVANTGEPKKALMREAVDGSLKRRCTVRLDADIWAVLSAEARTRGVPVASVAREWLRRSVGLQGAPREGHPTEAPSVRLVDLTSAPKADLPRERNVLLTF